MAANFTTELVSETRDYHGVTRVYNIGFGVDRGAVTTLTTSPLAVEAWLVNAQAIELYGFPEEILLAGVAVTVDPVTERPVRLQICIGSICLLYQFSSNTQLTIPLLDFFVNPNIFFACCGKDYVMGMLEESFGNLIPFEDPDCKEELTNDVGMWVDVGHLAEKRLGNATLSAMGLRDLAREVLPFFVPMAPPAAVAAALGNADLTNEEISNGSYDAYLSFQLGRDLEAWNP